MPSTGGNPIALASLPRKTDLPSVLLLHTLADGSEHVDWMIACDESGDGPLVTFRMPALLDDLAKSAASLEIERIADHRPDYLAYEGPISGDRGSVRRIASGTITILENTGHSTLLHTGLISGGGEPRTLAIRLVQLAENRYRLEFTGKAGPDAAE